MAEHIPMRDHSTAHNVQRASNEKSTSQIISNWYIKELLNIFVNIVEYHLTGNSITGNMYHFTDYWKFQARAWPYSITKVWKVGSLDCHDLIIIIVDVTGTLVAF